MLSKNIVLIGFMGSGKSMTSNKLASLLKKEVFSTDEMIEQKEGRSISEIFSAEGEDYFREKEREAVQEISNRQGVVIDCGGGVVLNPENMNDLKRNGIVFYLSAPVDFLFEQIKGYEHRPLMNVDDPKAKIEEMLKVRDPLYRQADHVIDSDQKSIDQIVEDIQEIIKNES